mmetsp:Transcript_98729/g.169943  ORF Transcript_98729/g.169943 Transcript_98729/m.169943 type:complete len:203 (+) Transcript_98729:477-1085(+)
MALRFTMLPSKHIFRSPGVLLEGYPLDVALATSSRKPSFAFAIRTLISRTASSSAGVIEGPSAGRAASGPPEPERRSCIAAPSMCTRSAYSPARCLRPPPKSTTSAASPIVAAASAYKETTASMSRVTVASMATASHESFFARTANSARGPPVSKSRLPSARVPRRSQAVPTRAQVASVSHCIDLQALWPPGQGGKLRSSSR